MRSMALFLVSIIYGLANFYIGNRIVNIARNYFAFNLSLLVYIPILILTLSSLVAYLEPTKNWKIIGTIGIYWFGFVILAFLILGMTDILLFLISHITKSDFSDYKCNYYFNTICNRNTYSKPHRNYSI